ncbi:MAG: sugar phosphate nucleotidyltransferase [Terriglobales bacterium]
MKGIILAGGLGSRLQPLTTITNKHLLPVYDRPMVWFAIETLVAAGIADILLVTGGEHAGDFLRLLENGEAFGCGLRYAYQRGEGGIAAALALARDFAAGSPLAVLLGDNLFEHGVAAAAAEFARQPRGARLLLKQVPDPERFGVPVFDPAGRILRIEEKPARPASGYAVAGCYFYDDSVFDKIARCRPSGRRELEITDVNNLYLAEGALEYSLVEGWWCDAGTFDSLHRASGLIERQRRAAPAPEPENNPVAPRRRAGPRGHKEAAEHKRDARHRRAKARAMEVRGAPAWGTGPTSRGEHKRDARHRRAESRAKEGPRAEEVRGAPAWGTGPTSRGEHKRDARRSRAGARAKK